MPRLFLALNIPDNIRAEIARAQEGARRQFRHSRVVWVAPENFHVTLHFLGEVGVDLQARLIEELHAIEYPAAFELRLRGTGAFPNSKDPKTLFVVATMPTEAQGLHRRTADALIRLGFEIDRRPWDTHITIGRVKNRAETFRPEAITVKPLSFTVASFELMRSTLTPEGSAYNFVVSFALA